MDRHNTHPELIRQGLLRSSVFVQGQDFSDLFLREGQGRAVSFLESAYRTAYPSPGFPKNYRRDRGDRDLELLTQLREAGSFGVQLTDLKHIFLGQRGVSVLAAMRDAAFGRGVSYVVFLCA